MKKHIALLLVATLALTAMLGLAPISSAEAESPAAATVPEIFVNVAVTANVEFHIAVPAEDYSEDLSILVWQDASTSGLYSANDDNVEALEFNGIDEENGLAVFTYKRIGAAEMFKNIYIRALIEDESGNRTYGDVIDYSIAEWAHYHLTDAGSPLNEAKKDMVAAMIDYGHFASIYADSADKTPAAADLVDYKKVSVTAKLNGYALFTQTTQLVKPGEAVALRAPHVDGATINAWSGDGVADGKITTSENATVVADYTANAGYFSGDDIGTGWSYDSVNGFQGSYSTVTHASNALTIKYPTASSSMYYATTNGLNPAGSADGRVGKITSSHRYFAFKPTTDASGNKALFISSVSSAQSPNAVTMYPKFFSQAGIGDTIAPVINFTFEIASVNGKFGTSTMAFRLNLRTAEHGNNSTGNIINNILTIKNNELILLAGGSNLSNDSETAKFALNNDNLLHKYAVSVAMIGEGQYMLYAYAENEQTGKMELVASTEFTPLMPTNGSTYGINNFIDFATLVPGQNGITASTNFTCTWSTAGGYYSGLDTSHAGQHGYDATNGDFDAAMLAEYATNNWSFLFGSLYYSIGNIYNK